MGSKAGSLHQADAKTNRISELHPIWRGIGFLMFILAPIMGYFGAMFLLEANAAQHWLPVPVDLLIPGRDPMLLIKIILTLTIMFILIAIFQFIAFAIYRIFAPPRYGPMDMPRVAYRGKRKK